MKQGRTLNATVKALQWAAVAFALVEIIRYLYELYKVSGHGN